MDFKTFYDDAIKLGALGGKMMGAGGGGAFYFVAPAAKHEKIKAHFHHIKTWLPMRFSSHGSQIILDKSGNVGIS